MTTPTNIITALWMEWQLELYEMTFFVIILIVIVIIIIRFCRLGYLSIDKMHGSVALAFDTASVTVYVDWLKLPDGGRNYRLRTPINSAPKLYAFYCFGIMSLDVNGWSVMNTTTGEYLSIPTWVFVSGIKTRKLTSRVLCDEYTVSVASIHSHYVEYAPMEAMTFQPGTRTPVPRVRLQENENSPETTV